MKNKSSLTILRAHLLFLVRYLLFFMMFHVSETFAHNTGLDTSGILVPAMDDSTLKLFGGKITNNGFGGIGIKFTRINGQLAIMTGGRGAIIINNQIILGGSGYGIANSIRLVSPNPGTSRNLKIGYGGLAGGYIFYPGETVNYSAMVLIAAGASFWQSQPKKRGREDIRE
jgi:hypothetical protein